MTGAGLRQNGGAAVSLEHEITKKASTGTLCVAELREFLEEIAKASEGHYPESLKVKARVSFGGGLKSISVTIPGGSERQ
jgi:hypothetical protein